MPRFQLAALLAAATMLEACERRPPAAAGEFGIVRVKPDGEALFLNQGLTIYLSEQVDPLSVTADTIRVVDARGHPIGSVALEIGSHSVTVRPRPPVQPGLTDGSFLPESRYTLEVAGYPQTNALRSRDGRVLAAGLRLPFTTAGLAGRDDYRRPLLPVGMGDEPFALDPDRRLDALAETGELRLHFTLPPHPPSVRPDAFLVQAWDPVAEELRRVAVRSAAVVPDPADRFFGSTVVLGLGADPPLRSTDHLSLFILQEGPDALVDYAGRPVRLGGQRGGERLQVFVQAGPHLRLLELDAAERPRLVPADAALPGFEVRDDARFTPRVRLGAGRGTVRVQPTSSLRWEPPVAADGHGAVLELAALDVPSGVRLTLVGNASPLRILVSGSVRIEGELLLETAVGPLLDPIFGAFVPEADLPNLAGCVLIAAGDIEVSGRISHAFEADQSLGPAIALIAGGDLRLGGRVPPRTVFASEGEVRGNLQRGTLIQVRLAAGWAGEHPIRAEAWSPWLRVPSWHRGPLGVSLRRPQGALRVSVQTGPPHPIDPDRVDERADLWSMPTPAEAGIEAGAGSFVRFLLSADVAPGAALPSLGGIELVAR